MQSDQNLRSARPFRALGLLPLILVSDCSIQSAYMASESRDPISPTSAAQPHPNSINGQLGRPWFYTAGTVASTKWEQDKARCCVIGNLAPANGGTPEIAHLVTFINCLKAEGYQPQDPGKEYRQSLLIAG
jgi:hypothetical protein